MVIYFSFFCARHWGTGLEVQGHRVWSGKDMRTDSLGSCLSNYIINRAWSFYWGLLLLVPVLTQPPKFLVPCFPFPVALFVTTCPFRLWSLHVTFPLGVDNLLVLDCWHEDTHFLFGLCPALSHSHSSVSSILSLKTSISQHCLDRTQFLSTYRTSDPKPVSPFYQTLRWGRSLWTALFPLPSSHWSFKNMLLYFSKWSHGELCDEIPKLSILIKDIGAN